MHSDKAMLCGQCYQLGGSHNAASWFVPELHSTWDTVSFLLNENSQQCTLLHDDFKKTVL
jgi:hypothetical protein